MLEARPEWALRLRQLGAPGPGAGQAGWPVGGGAGHEDSPCPLGGSEGGGLAGEGPPAVEDRAVETQTARGATGLALGTLICASWLYPSNPPAGEIGGRGGGDSYPKEVLPPSPRPNNKVVLVRLGTCARNHLYTFGLLRARRGAGDW